MRAFGCLIDDLLMHSNEIEEKVIKHFSSLKDLCFNEVVSERPTFKEIYQIVLSVN